jgi:hypothetical protein
VCKDKEKKVDFRMQFLDFLQQKFIVFQLSSVPLFTCIFFAEKAKKDFLPKLRDYRGYVRDFSF